LRARIQYVHDTYHQGALVEEFIEGREINAGVIGNSPVETLPLSEIHFHPGLPHSIVSYEGKWLEESSEFAKTEPVCPAQLKAKEEFLIRDVALRAFKILECRDYARVDMRLRDGVPYILEVNANPDISPGAGLAKAARAGGLSYQKLIDRILGMAVKRKEMLHAKP
jgi:D-alanine-D-alanine ligase